jgi:hypothetical protein
MVNTMLVKSNYKSAKTMVKLCCEIARKATGNAILN